MSDLLINIRLFYWHFQVSKNWNVAIKYNDYHKDLQHGWFDICEFNLFKK